MTEAAGKKAEQLTRTSLSWHFDLVARRWVVRSDRMDGRNAQTAVIRRRLGERIKSTDIIEKVGKLSGPKFSHLCRT